MPPPSASPQAESDLDRTAELPALDPTVVAAVIERQGATDTQLTPPPPLPGARRAAEAAAPAAASARPRNDAELQAAAERLRTTQELLARKDERLAQVERARDEAQAARFAAEQRAAQLNDELAQLHRAAAQLTDQLDEAQDARTSAERRATHLDGELAQARLLGSTARGRAVELQRNLDERQGAGRDQPEQLPATDRAHDRTHTAGLESDLERARARAATYHEALQSAEGYRGITESLVGDLQREVAAREREIAHMAAELSGHHAQARRQDAELGQRAARVARLEQQVNSFAAALAQRDAQLRETRQEAENLHATSTRLQTELTGASGRLLTMQTLADQHSTTDARLQEELDRVLAERASLSAAVEAARAAAAAASAQATWREAALVAADARSTELQEALTAEQRRAGQLEGELASVRGEMEDWGSALSAAQKERSTQATSLSAAETQLRELQRRAAEQHGAIDALQTEVNTSAARARELESDLRVAEEAVHRLESEARSRNARIAELEKSNQHWRLTASEARSAAETRAAAEPRGAAGARAAVTDTALNPALQDAARVLAPGVPPSAPEPGPDGAARLLIRAEGGREVVHVLGRKTSIGRTPDNDLQIEANYISRHHAVILAGPVNTLIEDLNSTNGVQVNGRRVIRHTLKDGDTIVFGRAQYRFVLGKGADKR